MLMRLGSNPAIGSLLFGFVFLTHSVSPISQSGDSFWTVPVMMRMLFEGTTNLDAYPEFDA